MSNEMGTCDRCNRQCLRSLLTCIYLPWVLVESGDRFVNVCRDCLSYERSANEDYEG